MKAVDKEVSFEVLLTQHYSDVRLYSEMSVVLISTINSKQKSEIYLYQTAQRLIVTPLFWIENSLFFGGNDWVSFVMLYDALLELRL